MENTKSKPRGCPYHSTYAYRVVNDKDEEYKPLDPMQPSSKKPPASGSSESYCRVFDREPDQHSPELLRELGESMADIGTDPGLNTQVPAGYTYLGQFIDHDITRMDGAPPLGVATPANIEALKNKRSRTLDLDSVYGPAKGANAVLDPANPDKLMVGHTHTPNGLAASFELPATLPNDLPRASSASQPGVAMIHDPRNDENLAVAQTHLLFIKLHNAFVEKHGLNFIDARKATIQHYQRMIIDDFLPHIIDPDILGIVMANDYLPLVPDSKCMPLEFAVAAYRFGHSMVRNSYKWNRIFTNDGLLAPASLAQLFQFSAGSGNLGVDGNTSLPTQWVVDWRHLYGLGDHDKINFARKFDTRLALKLEDLPEFEDEAQDNLKNLAVRNLLRGAQMELPSGQQVAAILSERFGREVQGISNTDIPFDNASIKSNTPLWYYVLCESVAQNNGNKLGEVGSWIVADTFKRLLLDSENSVLSSDFSPSPDVTGESGVVTMPGMLIFVDDINPLGN